MKRSYFTDLADAEWECLSSRVPAPNKRERPRIHRSRLILDTIFYILRSGCPWRLLPRELERLGRPSNYWFRRWRIDGTLERLNRALGERLRAQLEASSASEEDLDHYVHNPRRWSPYQSRRHLRRPSTIGP